MDAPSESEDRIAFLSAEVERLETVNQKLWRETAYLFGVLLAVRQHAQMLMDVATPKEGS